jgi:hypothetical protein
MIRKRGYRRPRPGVSRAGAPGLGFRVLARSDAEEADPAQVVDGLSVTRLDPAPRRSASNDGPELRRDEGEETNPARPIAVGEPRPRSGRPGTRREVPRPAADLEHAGAGRPTSRRRSSCRFPGEPRLRDRLLPSKSARPAGSLLPDWSRARVAWLRMQSPRPIEPLVVPEVRHTVPWRRLGGTDHGGSSHFHDGRSGC